MTKPSKEYKDMIKEFSELRDKVRGLSKIDRSKFIQDYIDNNFKKDVAMFTGIAVKIYTYLGWEYFNNTTNSVTNMIKLFKDLDKISF